MKRAGSPPTGAASKRPKLDAASILASIPTANTDELSTAGKFSFAKKKDEGAEGDAPGLSAAANCFAGLTFVFTGVFSGFDRPVLEAFSKEHGAKVTSSISGKTSALVVGESDVGPSKIQKAKDKNLKIINEQGFLQLVEQMPEGGGSGEAAAKAREKQEKEQREARSKAEEMRRVQEENAEQQRVKEEAKQRVKSESQDVDMEAPSSSSAGAPAGAPDSAAPSAHTPTTGALGTDLWTSRYAPKQLDDICGNPGVVRKLSHWLNNWRANQRAGFKPGSEGAEFRAAMLHGAPGIGKTTAAHLVAKMQGFDVIEYNASDTRSKKLLQESVASTLSNTSLAGFLGAKGKSAQGTQKPMCIIMDEVDGMSAGDRGGVGQMAAFARKTNVPLILICNERTLPKMRPFDKVCFELPFRRPDAGSIRKRLQSIAMVEGLEIDGATIDQLVAQTRSDIRQILNLLSTYATTKKHMSGTEGAAFSKSWQKESALKPFDIVQKYLSPVLWREPSLDAKIELYFNDYAFAPLMVQENYLKTRPRSGDPLKQAIKAAESISDGDLVDRFIHGSQPQWSLMPLHAVLSCVRPSFYINGQTSGMLGFSAWLGNNSKAGKYKRLLVELESHVRLKLWAGTQSLRSEFLMDFVEMLLTPLKQRGADAIQDVIEVMDAYYLTREDFDVVMELGVGKNSPETVYKSVPTAVKSAFTRKYNTSSHPVPFMKFVDTKAAAKTQAVPDLDDVVDDDMEVKDEPETNGDDLESELAKDKYIKQAKPKAKKAAPKAAAKKAPAKPRAPRKTAAKK